MSHPSSQRESPTTQRPGAVATGIEARRATDNLISIRDIRKLFALGRTAAYELTHRPGFPQPVMLSSRCYRWWAHEVTAFAATMRREGASPKQSGHTRRMPQGTTQPERSSSLRITGKMRFARQAGKSQ